MFDILFLYVGVVRGGGHRILGRRGCADPLGMQNRDLLYFYGYQKRSFGQNPYIYGPILKGMCTFTGP